MTRRASGYARSGGGWTRLKRQTLDRDGHRCYSPHPDVCAGTAITADHVVPISAGGAHDLSNLAAICAPCHDRKTEAERIAGLRRAVGKAAPRVEAHPGVIRSEAHPGDPDQTRGASAAKRYSTAGPACACAPFSGAA